MRDISPEAARDFFVTHSHAASWREKGLLGACNTLVKHATGILVPSRSQLASNSEGHYTPQGPPKIPLWHLSWIQPSRSTGSMPGHLRFQSLSSMSKTYPSKGFGSPDLPNYFRDIVTMPPQEIKLLLLDLSSKRPLTVLIRPYI